MLTYNHEKFIQEAIQSVIDQTYDNWELIIVDNASTDSTRTIIETMIAGDERIIFLPQEQNLYVSHGANITMEAAKGEYIALFSGDDVFIPEKLEKQLAFMQQNDLDLSFSWITAIDEYSKPSAPDVQKWFNKAECSNINDILKAYFSMHNVTYAPTALMKTALLQKTHLFDHRLLQTQDMELWIRLMKQTNKVKIFHERLTQYRVLEDGGNLSSNDTPIKRNRTNFEMVQLWKELFSIDNTTLSRVFDISITNANKYAIIYDHMQKKPIVPWQYAILTDIYTQLTEKCDTKTELFELFFDNYGRFSIVSDDTLIQKEEAIAWLEGQVESYQKSLIEKERSLIEKEKMISTYQKILQEVDIKILQMEDELSSKTDHIEGLEKELGFKKTFKRLIKFTIGRV